MEDWQEWQIRADQIATALNSELDALEATFFTDGADDFNYRAFWPRFRDLKERVRTAPAIRLEPKLDLERRLRTIGSRAYKSQEGAYARSAERKVQLLEQIGSLRSASEQENTPRGLRLLRRDFDKMREQFDTGPGLVPADRQAVWEAWREANQSSWQRLTTMWSENEAELRSILQSAREQLEQGKSAATRQLISRFFEALKNRETKQDAVQGMRNEADALRREADELDQRATVREVAATPPPSAPPVSPAEGWRSELGRNRELAMRLSEELAELDRRVQDADSVLEQAMLRGTVVEKRRKLSELDRANRALEQRIEQTEETPLLTIG